MKLSIVTTLYQSALFIDEFYQRSTAVAKQLAGEDYEFILVNDGSSDDSLNLAVQLAEQDSHVIVLDLSRNLGHHKAMMTGLSHAIGDLIFLIDSDLEEEPETLLSFKHQMDAEVCDVVYGVQSSRKGGWFERLSGSLFYSIFDLLTSIEHPRNLVTMRLMTRRYVEALFQFKEHEMVISCLWVITGFNQQRQVINKGSRLGSSYSLLHKISHAVNAITSFSAAPLKFIFYIGCAIFSISLFYAIYIIYQRLFNQHSMDGWTSLIISIWLLSGLMILFIGIIRVYLSKIFMETKHRPTSIIRKIYGR